jgi:hypothetical protein
VCLATSGVPLVDELQLTVANNGRGFETSAPHVSQVCPLTHRRGGETDTDDGDVGARADRASEAARPTPAMNYPIEARTWTISLSKSSIRIRPSRGYSKSRMT